MDPDLVLYLGKRGLETALLISAPVLIVTLVLGVVTGMLQAVTSLRDQTLGVVIKLGAVGLTLLLAGAWMMQVAVGFTMEVFNHMQSMGH
jgi:flagellar biosynthesis protein FliQ